MLKFAIVGYDHVHVLKYLPTIAHHPEASLIGIAAIENNKEMAKNAATKYRCRYFESVESVLSPQELDAIYIASTPAKHSEIIKEAAKQNIHILCDKPLATTLYDADEILSAAEKSGIKLMVPFNPRFQLPVIRLKTMIRNGDIGEVLYINAVKYGKIPSLIKNINTSWFFDPEQAGFGGFGDIGIHAVDALCWLSESKPKKVYARLGNHIHPGLGTDDIGSAIIEFDNGVIANLNSGWANPVKYPSWLDVKFEVLGSKKVVSISKAYHDFTLYNGDKIENVNWWRTDIDMVVEEFIQSILKDREPAITGRDAMTALEVILAAYQSSTTGQEVQLPL